ncbi:MAG TPA: ABC transporter transmembrane domain-containing protein [Aestuariivirgaceae bacterium]|nr:ABC transporter transmembrane domain-containing protein [Aestuariivirgaceae bacterium]
MTLPPGGADDSAATALADIKVAEPRLGWQIWSGTLAINLLSLALPLTILQAYDRILPHHALGTFTLISIGATTAILLETAMRMARATVLGKVTAAFEYRIVTAGVERILGAPVQTISQIPAGALLDKMQSIETLRGYHTGQSRLALIDVPFAGVFILLMYLLGGQIALVPFVLMLFLAPLNLRRVRQEEAVTIRRRADEDRRTDLLIEILKGIRTVKILAAEALMMRRHDRLQQTTVNNSYDNLQIGNSNQSLSTLFANLVLVTTVAFGAYLVILGQLSVGALAACTTLAGRAVQPILRLYAIQGQMMVTETARRRIADILALPQQDRTGQKQEVPIQGKVVLSNVTFTHAGGQKPIFRDLSLTIPAGSIYGITGLDLAGKSTLARLIAGEIRPSRGEVTLDGHDMSGDNAQYLRHRIALVGQERSLFEGTILDNIAMFRQGEGVTDALKAARLIGLELDIQRLPMGYDTHISDSIAEELPASFAHRIMIARALARRPRVLILDQANAGLDIQSDRLLREALQSIKGSATVILVTERPSLLRVADKLFELDNGNLIPRAPIPQPAPQPEAASEVKHA